MPYSSFQAVCLLRISADLEAKANMLRKEALQCITVALAGSDSKKFFTLMTTYFGANQMGTLDDDPWDFLDAAPEIPPPLPLMETDTEDDGARSVKSGSSATQALQAKPGASKCKAKILQQKDLLPDLCDSRDAIRMYPADQASLNETGIPFHLQVRREHQTTRAGASVYLCRHDKCQDPPFYAQSPAGLYSHVRRKHLGIILSCPYCADKVYWNTKGWNSHMNTHHKEVPKFGSALVDEAKVAQEFLASTRKQAFKPSPSKSKKKPKKDQATPSGSSSSSRDSSSDSSSSTRESSSSNSESKGAPAQKTPKLDLTSEQLQYLAEGASTLVNDPLADMPPLEECPPPAFPKPSKQQKKGRKDH